MLNPEGWDRHRDRLVRAFRAVRPWFDPRSYRSLVLLVVVSMAVFLWPLAHDVAVALFFMLPLWFRKGLGQTALLALIALGLRRLWRVHPTDTWPSPIESNDPEAKTTAARWIPWALRLAVASLVFPLMRNPDGLGFADWDFDLEKYEALRRTIAEWRQFPWWDPWCRGGFPLSGEPQIGAFSISTPLVLAFGTRMGLALGVICFMLIAVEGAYRLAWLWFREPWSAAAAALIYGLNGAMVINTAQGYIMVASYCSLPWLAYYAFRVGDRFSAGLGLGFWMAFGVLNRIQYLSLYGGVLTGLIWIRALRLQPYGQRLRLVVNTVASVGIFLALCGWRLGTVLPVLADDKRERITYWDETIATMFHYLLERPTMKWITDLPGELHAVYIELTCYVGLLVVILGFASLLLGWRWWHTLTLVCAWLAIGSIKWYQPSAWLTDWPLFGSAHVVTRWRFVALLGLGLAVGAILARWRASARGGARALGALVVVIIGVDYVVLNHQQLPLAFSIKPESELFPSPPVTMIVNVRDGLGYACLTRGYGVIRGYEPMLSYRRDAPTLRRSREDSDYRGEAWTDEGPIEPVYWSPNRLVFQVQPGQDVHINQNPGSWWWVNGKPAFPELQCAELMVPFTVKADDRGRLDLGIHPRGLEAGIGLHVLGCLLLAAAIAAHVHLSRGTPPTSRESSAIRTGICRASLVS